MTQKQGNSSADGGRVDGSIGTPIVAANIALGVGWGDGANVITVIAGSNDQRGSFTIQSIGANQAQATATVALTFADGAYASVPFAIVTLANNDNAVTTAQPQAVACSTTVLSFTQSVLPVATKIYKFNYHVIA